MKRLIFISLCILTFILFLSGCDSTKQQVSEDHPAKYTFQDFLHKFKRLPLPFKYRAEYVSNDYLRFIDPMDTIYINNQSAIYYGLLEDTTHFFGIITLIPGDQYYPVLTTFDKKGHRIDTKKISVNGYSAGSYIEYCSSTSMIAKDLTLFCIDTTIAPMTDGTYKIIPGTDSIFTTFIKGKITRDGKIDLEPEMKVQAKQ